MKLFVLALATPVFCQQHGVSIGARVTDESLGISSPDINSGFGSIGSVLASGGVPEGFVQGLSGEFQLQDGLAPFPGALGGDTGFGKRAGLVVPGHVEIGPGGQRIPQFTNMFFASHEHVAHLGVQPPSLGLAPPHLARRARVF
ncbi:hypothetical protein DL89DRAFT_266654, partial [Linderina pennispora]